MGESGSDEVDLEGGGNGTGMKKGRRGRRGKDCRICQLSFDGSNVELGSPMELGCSCKEDLAAVHRPCAEAWFKIRGNKICEVCGSVAKNVGAVAATTNEGVLPGQQWEELNETTTRGGGTATVTETTVRVGDEQRFWRGHRFLNFLLACMVFALLISWLFHFNVPSS